MAGNKRYVAGKVRHPNQTARRRTEVAKGQHPFAVILGCADSRVPPELIFDQGLGDLFVVRVAGNIADEADLGSIEYAVEHVGSRLIMVLGHEKCGAVAAALEVVEKGITLPGHLPAVVKPILPAVEAVKGKAGDRLDEAVRANVRLVVNRLKASEPVIGEMARAGKIKIVGGRYDLTSGAVELIA
jgi:carbonic anhydrase